MIVPFDLELLNPASIDVLLGDNLMIESPVDTTMQLHSLQGYTAQDPYSLRPGEFVLAETRETFNIPEHISGQFALKSSRAREGYSHMLAGWIDPGFCGSRLTLELKNERQLHRIPLWPGMKIGQIVFHKMSARPLVSYREVGNYNHKEHVTPSLVAA